MHQDHCLSAYDYHLPPANIAQHPAARRDNSRLLVLDQTTQAITHRQFAELTDLIPAGDLLVANDTQVFPARLLGHKDSGGKAEVFLLEFPAEQGEYPGRAVALALIKSSKRPKVQSIITIGPDLQATVLALLADGKARLQLHFNPTRGLAATLSHYGQIPLPPYISRREGSTAEDRQRYQTVYASRTGAVAAPTAGLHFTPELLSQLTSRGVGFATITLHVGYGTFAPVRQEIITEHAIHAEYMIVPPATVEAIRATKARGGQVWAVGTTTVRALEFAAQGEEGLQAVADWCSLYIYPGFQFKVIDNLITNFHLPGSSLLFLVAALCGRETLLSCYGEAIREGYRFYSYGDAMAICSRPARASR